MKKTVILLTLLLASLFSYCQTNGVVAVYSNPLGGEYNGIKYADFPDGSNNSRNALKHKNLVGSLYINDAFLNANLSGVEGVSGDALLRYDAYNDQMEVKVEGKTKYLKKIVGLLIEIKDQKKRYQVFNLKIKKEEKGSFFGVLSKGEKISLLSKESIRFYREVHPSTGYEEYKPPTLKRAEDKLYIGFKNYSTIEIPKKKKDILKLFSSNSKEIENYTKSNNLSFKKKDDLIKIFEYYSSL